MKKSFNSSAKRAGWMLEAKYFEDVHGLSGISGHYAFPGGMDAFQFAASGGLPPILHYYDFSTPSHPRQVADIPPAVLEGARELWGSLVGLNPLLKKVKPDANSLLSLHAALYGAASCFNADDIAYFVDLLQSEKDIRVYAISHQKREIISLMKQIEPFLEKRIEWVASPKTLQKIKDGLAKRITPKNPPGFAP